MFNKGANHIDVALTNAAVKVGNENYIADQIMPVIPVVKQTDKYTIYGADHFRIPSDLRAKGTAANMVRSYSTTFGTYSCDVRALIDIVLDEDMQNADSPIEPSIDTTVGLTQMLLLSREKQVADAVFNTTTFASYTASLSAADKWDNYTASNPITKIDSVKSLVRKQIGAMPNALAISQATFDKLKEHPALREIYKYTKGQSLSKDLVASALGLQYLYVGSAVYNTAAEGIAASNDDIWGKYALVFYKTPGVSLKTPNMGYLISWKLFGNGTVRVRKWRDEEREGDIIEAAMAYDPRVVSAASGYLLQTVIS